MKINSSSLALLIIACSLGIFVYFYEIQGSEKREIIQTNSKKLFNFTKEDIQTFSILKQDQILQFEKSGKQPKPWQMKQPNDTLASDAAISFLLNLLVNSDKDRSVKISSQQLSEYGLENPLANIDIQLKNGKYHQLILGNTNFNNSLIYALVDTSDNIQTEFEVFLLPINFKYAVERQLEEWQEPELNSENLNLPEVNSQDKENQNLQN